MTDWGLPTSIDIGEIEYPINSDFRDILEIISILNDMEKNEKIRFIVSLSLFYDGFEKIPPELYQEAAEKMMLFIACGEKDDGRPHPKTIDWEQDRLIIVSEINKVSGTEVRALEYLHWWTFIAYFNAIGEGQLSMIVSIREKIRKGKKLEKFERDFYNKNRTRIDFKNQYTQKEKEILQKWFV